MDNGKLRIEFGLPGHGWLPVKVDHGDFHLEFMASNVPENPIDQLITSLLLVSDGIPSHTWWHLEPQGYWFEFSKDVNGCGIKISSAENARAKRLMIYSLEGADDEILLPVYRAIKRLHADNIGSPHWQKIDEVKIQKLRATLKGSSKRSDSFD
jgi:hypothetical protein